MCAEIGVVAIKELMRKRPLKLVRKRRTRAVVARGRCSAHAAHTAGAQCAHARHARQAKAARRNTARPAARARLRVRGEELAILVLCQRVDLDHRAVQIDEELVERLNLHAVARAHEKRWSEGRSKQPSVGACEDEWRPAPSCILEMSVLCSD
eukprot:3524564-Pleurochrysis_carterae.AAC.1